MSNFVNYVLIIKKNYIIGVISYNGIKVKVTGRVLCMLAARINIRVSVNVWKRHFYRRKHLQPFRRSSDILGIFTDSFRRPRFGDYYRETLCNYLNLRNALLSWSPCRMLRYFRMYLWAVRVEENCLLPNFISGHLVMLVQCIRGASLVTLREKEISARE